MLGIVDEIRRYPVKAMGGESLDEALVDARGIIGDRMFAVADDDGKLASCKNTSRFRRHDEVIAFRAHTADAGHVVVTTEAGATFDVGDRRLDEHLSEVWRRPVVVRAEGEVAHHDGAPVSLIGTATLEHCRRAWGIDAEARRLRPSLVVATDRAFEEEDWIGRQVQIGEAVLSVIRRIPRCRTIDLPQDGVAPDQPWLARLGAEREGFVAVYADVARPGRVAVGEQVRPAAT